MTTKHFFQETQDFINKHVDDPELKADYFSALMTVMKSNLPTIQPVRFADDHFKAGDRQGLLDHLEEARVPTGEIDKNIALIEGQLRRTQYDFESGLALIGPVDSFEKHVVIVREDEGRSRTEVRDKLTDVRAR